jgi:NADH-quinone oxidoreductase subunit L
MATGLAAHFPRIYRILSRKYYIDEFYDATIVHPTLKASTEGLWKITDSAIIDGAINGVGELVQGLASVLKRIQNGLLRSYATWIFLGMVAILFYLSLSRS